MGDTVKLNVTITWIAIPGLVLATTYAFQNTVNQTMYLRQQSAVPGSSDTGFELQPSKIATLIKETNDIYVRMAKGNGVAYLNEVV